MWFSVIVLRKECFLLFWPSAGDPDFQFDERFNEPLELIVDRGFGRSKRLMPFAYQKTLHISLVSLLFENASNAISWP